MYKSNAQHVNPSKFKIPYHLCNRREQSFAHTIQSQSSQQYSQQSQININYYDQMSDQNRGLRHELDQLKKFNMQLRRKLQNKQKELEETDREFKQALIKYNKRLELANFSMTDILMSESKDHHIQKQKSRSRSKSKLLAIKKQLRSISIDYGGFGKRPPSSSNLLNKYQKQ